MTLWVGGRSEAIRSGLRSRSPQRDLHPKAQRSGDVDERVDAAQRAYARALTLRRDHVGALSNMVALHRSRGLPRQASGYEKRLRRAQASDPFSQFLIAQSRAAAGAQREAIVHYQRAIRLLPGEPRFHRSLAEAYQQQGKLAAAERARARASEIEARLASRRGIREAPAPG